MLLVLLPTCNLDSFGVAVLLEGIVSPGDETGEEATGLHQDSTQHNLAGGVWQHRVALDNNLGVNFPFICSFASIHIKWKITN